MFEVFFLSRISGWALTNGLNLKIWHKWPCLAWIQETLADGEWRAAAPRLTPLRLPRAQDPTSCSHPIVDSITCEVSFVQMCTLTTLVSAKHPGWRCIDINNLSYPGMILWLVWYTIVRIGVLKSLSYSEIREATGTPPESDPCVSWAFTSRQRWLQYLNRYWQHQAKRFHR